MKFHSVLVIYNEKCTKSPSVNYLVSQRVVLSSFILCDNSTDESIKKNNRLFCEKSNIVYIDMKGNMGLSKAYNKAISLISDHEDNWVVFFDQDTRILPDFFEQLESSIKEHPDIYIHVPYVLSSQKGIQISPSKIFGYHVKRRSYPRAAGVYFDSTAINTGMAVKRCVFSKVGKYNEELFLDYIDHYFIREYKKYFKGIVLFNARLMQEFSDHEQKDFDAEVKRFMIYKRDFYVFCKNSFWGRFYYFAKITFRSFKLSLKHKNITFLILLVLKSSGRDNENES